MGGWGVETLNGNNPLFPSVIIALLAQKTVTGFVPADIRCLDGRGPKRWKQSSCQGTDTCCCTSTCENGTDTCCCTSTCDNRKQTRVVVPVPVKQGTDTCCCTSTCENREQTRVVVPVPVKTGNTRVVVPVPVNTGFDDSTIYLKRVTCATFLPETADSRNCK